MKNVKAFILIILFLCSVYNLCFAQIKPMGFIQKIVTPPSNRFYNTYKPKLKILDDTLYVCSNTGIYRKSLQSQTDWELYAFENKAIIEFVKNGNNILAISTGTRDGKDSLLLLSNNNGQSFIDYTSSHFLEYEFNYLSRIVQNPQNNNSLLVLHVNGGVSKSDDFGLNWKMLNEDNFANQNWHLGFHPLDTTVLFYTGETMFFAGAIYKSSDVGNTWNRYLHPDGDCAIHSIAFHPTNPDILVYGAELAMGKSTDKGETWQVKGLPNSVMYFYKVLFDEGNPTVLYASGIDRRNSDANDTIRVYRSIDTGETWQLAYNEGLLKGCGGVYDMVKYKNKLIFYTRDCGLFELDLETTPLSNPTITVVPELIVYPNPVRNTLHFETDAIINQVDITDMTGRLVLQTNMKRNINQIDVSSLNKGMYLTTFYSIDKGRVTKKIQIIH